MAAAVSMLWLHTMLSMDILETMNTSVNPCDDFYQFACGNYNTRVSLPDDRSNINQLSYVDKQIMKELKDLLEDKKFQHNASPSARLVRRIYHSCMNVTALEKVGLEPMLGVLDEFGGWPVLLGENWKEKGLDWIRMNAILIRRTGQSNVLNFYSASDFKNSSKRILHIDQPSLGLAKRDYYVNKNNSKAVDAYLKWMVSTAVQLGAGEPLAQSEMEEVLELETALAEASMRDEDRRDIAVLYNPMTIAELKKKYSKLNLEPWFGYMAEHGWYLDASDIVNVDSPPFLEKLPQVLKNYSARTVANYQLWRLIAKLSPMLAPSLRENYRQFQQALTGTPKFKVRWEECIEKILDQFSPVSARIPIGALYVKKYFSEKSKKDIDGMIETIREAMKGTIDTAEWMDDVTKKYAKHKLYSMVYNMAYPADTINNETWLMLSHKNANVTDDNYLQNGMQLMGSHMDRIISQFRDPVNRTEWTGMGFATVNAQYISELNKMTFPAGILRYPFYISYAPMHVNYGRIGAVMGHELTHGFDDHGRQFDADGNFNLWWTNGTLDEFTQGAKCFIDQYSNVEDGTTGLHLNGENTQGENIADNGGVKLAYKAYLQQRKIAPTADDVLPRLGNYTAEQIFFIAYGQVWCTLMRPAELRRRIIIDPHSPFQYRVNVVLQNNRHFADSFKCPVGSFMNPKQKCQIW